MKKLGLLISLSLLGLPAAAMDMADLQAYSKCKEGVERMDYDDQYDLGKFFAQAWQTVLRQEDWTPEERAEFDPKDDTSRHGLNGMTSSAQIAITMWDTKGEPFKPDHCLMGQFQIFRQPWSGVHNGFTDHLSSELKTLYFSLPER